MEKLALSTVLFGLLVLLLAFRIARISSPKPQAKGIAKPQSLRSKYGEQSSGEQGQENTTKPGGLSGELVGSGAGSIQNQRANLG
jgi:hypothetical protein